jgi:Zn finger protein HypA/HybF involved in hydrogenase expression|tara:strand:+ start:450 stop:641 length:192 start_codon:yes stop_codon:yes gene_type:complete
MNCWHCKKELIWGGDHDLEDNEEYEIITNLSCPNCHSYVEVYYPSEKTIKEYEKNKGETHKRF